MSRDNCFVDEGREYLLKYCSKQLRAAREAVPRMFSAEEFQYAAAVPAVPSVGTKLSKIDGVDDLLVFDRPLYLFLLIKDR